MEPEPNWKKTILVGGMFFVSYVSLGIVRHIPGYVDTFRALPDVWWWLENALRPLVPVFIGLTVLHGIRPGAWARALGLDRPAVPALVFAVILTLPMTLLPALLGVRVGGDLGFTDQLFRAGIWPLAEEINFRGFAFGQIYLYSGLGFWPAGMLTSGLFGIGHMANAAAVGLDLSGQLMNAGIVGASALVLAWLYARWGRNLWVVFFLHSLGNLAAALYMREETAVGDSMFLTLLAGTLVLAVGVTVTQARWSWSVRVVGREGSGSPT